MKHRYQAGDPFTVECARKGAEVSSFRANEPLAQMAGRKGRKASPWGRIPLNRNAKRTMRLDAIKRAAEKI